MLYGAFALLRLVQIGRRLDHLNLSDAPKLPLRMLDHWDNLDGTVERGYAGPSLWDWRDAARRSDPRYIDYARANASIGINGAVLNNVNADARNPHPRLSRARSRRSPTLCGPYGIRVYLSARFSAPIELGGLKTADPLDPAVRAWWRAKADEIYA